MNCADVEVGNNPTRTFQDTTQPIRQPFYTQIESYEKQLLTQALKRTNNNKTKTSEILSLPIMTLRRKLKKYDLDR